jgi:hypothetical protein
VFQSLLSPSAQQALLYYRHLIHSLSNRLLICLSTYTLIGLRRCPHFPFHSLHTHHLPTLPPSQCGLLSFSHSLALPSPPLGATGTAVLTTVTTSLMEARHRLIPFAPASLSLPVAGRFQPRVDLPVEDLLVLLGPRVPRQQLPLRLE